MQGFPSARVGESDCSIWILFHGRDCSAEVTRMISYQCYPDKFIPASAVVSTPLLLLLPTLPPNFPLLLSLPPCIAIPPPSSPPHTTTSPPRPIPNLHPSSFISPPPQSFPPLPLVPFSTFQSYFYSPPRPPRLIPQSAYPLSLNLSTHPCPTPSVPTTRAGRLV